MAEKAPLSVEWTWGELARIIRAEWFMGERKMKGALGEDWAWPLESMSQEKGEDDVTRITHRSLGT